MTLFGFLPEEIYSSKRNCIPAQRSFEKFHLFVSKAPMIVYYQDRTGNYTMHCYGTDHCILKSKFEKIKFRTFAGVESNKFSAANATYNYPNDELEIGGPVNITCKYSKSFCTFPTQEDNQLVFWNNNECLTFHQIGAITADIWTVVEKPLKQLMSFKNDHDSYNFLLGNYLKDNKTCLTNLRKTNFENIFVHSSVNITEYWIEDLNKYNVSKISNENSELKILTDVGKSWDSLTKLVNSPPTYLIIISCMLFLVTIIIIIINIISKRLKRSRRKINDEDINGKSVVNEEPMTHSPNSREFRGDGDIIVENNLYTFGITSV